MSKVQGISFFDRFLSLWVALCILAGIAIGKWLPLPRDLGQTRVRQCFHSYRCPDLDHDFPMMLKIDFGSIVHALKMPKGLTVTLVVNWLIKPFSMFGIAWLFFCGI